MKLKKICKYEGSIELLTGLSIKSVGNELGIGGADSEVVKNPITREPYIPGSSLKGKMRSQLERLSGSKNKSGADDMEKPCGCGKKNCMVCLLFGAHMNPNAESAPTRLTVRDCNLTEESRKLINELPLESGNYLEIKAENMINRKKGTAETPRFLERVPAGLKFHMEILIQIFENDDEKEFKDKVEQSLRMVEASYLGGSGSRGYGQVKFSGEWKDIELG